jgi:hypothetical protein
MKLPHERHNSGIYTAARGLNALVLENNESCQRNRVLIRPSLVITGDGIGLPAITESVRVITRVTTSLGLSTAS